MQFSNLDQVKTIVHARAWVRLDPLSSDNFAADEFP